MSKAVMLSHTNLVTNTYDAIACEPILPTDVNMAFLPYHHTFGATGQIVMLAAGTCTASVSYTHLDVYKRQII